MSDHNSTRNLLLLLLLCHIVRYVVRVVPCCDHGRLVLSFYKVQTEQEKVHWKCTGFLLANHNMCATFRVQLTEQSIEWVPCFCFAHSEGATLAHHCAEWYPTSVNIAPQFIWSILFYFIPIYSFYTLFFGYLCVITIVSVRWRNLKTVFIQIK